MAVVPELGAGTAAGGKDVTGTRAKARRQRLAYVFMSREEARVARGLQRKVG